MENQINISNLTPEQIEDLRQQLKAFDEQPKTIMDKVKSWEDARDIINPSYWISDDGNIFFHCNYSDATKICVPSKKHAKSLLATSQLMVIAEALNEGWKPDYKDMQKKYSVYYNQTELETYYCVSSCYNAIVFKSEEIAEYVIAQFPDLWYDYFMIDKPE